ncbi:complement resistance protein TraT [Candidatus Bandiella euplotis]|uniref:TraT domain containing protein n=1 Tax=Candidatus Bandiella euplotis TaxID=1664265 RepID=A0ABZ0UMX7_9RICK|nr:complement resistance protein TraT [Candidatus Bandiella woodruffii]WPX97466.1 Putative TraT domain containing protein [Candidatus Bandiella woodruffii]
MALSHLLEGISGYKKSDWQEKTNWKKYQTRIISVAKKVNGKFTEAQPELVKGLVRSISGLL